MPTTQATGQRIRQLRQTRGWTQVDLCEAMRGASRGKAYTDRSAVARWENGTHSVSLHMRPSLAQALGMSVAELFGD